MPARATSSLGDVRTVPVSSVVAWSAHDTHTMSDDEYVPPLWERRTCATLLGLVIGGALVVLATFVLELS